MQHKQQIQTLTEDIFPELVKFRRHFHQYPELSGQEEQTAVFIASVLTKWNIPHQTGVGGHGIVAIINGNNTGKCVALRADMDALPVQEKTNLDFCSKDPDVMHACGHDAHIASLLGSAYILNNMKSDFSGSVKLIFQPSEETFPGGAIKMIEENVLKNPDVDAIIGQHVLPQLKTGAVGMKPGRYMASTDEIYITVTGRGGHGATPELNIDPVVIAAQIIVALQQIPSRFASPSIPTVLSFGRFIADGRTNIIPDKVTIDGTIRTFDENWRSRTHELIEQISTGIAESFGASCQVFIHKGYPFLVNDDELTAFARNSAVEFLGNENVVDLPLRMTAEDFAYFSQQIPGVYYRLGISDPISGKPSSNLHTSTFDIDEKALKTGASFMANLALDILDHLNKKQQNA
jgi:amidohydrolase